MFVINAQWFNKMKKRNKAYKPREVLPVPLMFRHSVSGQLSLKLQPRMAFQRLREGAGTTDDLDTLACRLNWAFVAQRDFYQNQAVESSEGAISAIMGAKHRLIETGKHGFSGPEMLAVGDGLNLADMMCGHLTRKESLQAVQFVNEWNNKAMKGQQQ